MIRPTISHVLVVVGAALVGAALVGCAPMRAARYDRPLTVTCFDGTTRRGTAVVPARCGLWTTEACGGVSEGVVSLQGQYVLVGD